MDWQSTAWAMAFVAAVTIAANIAGRRPRRLGRVALIPADVVQLVGLIPFIGWIILIYWLVQPTKSPNRYGGAIG